MEVHHSPRRVFRLDPGHSKVFLDHAPTDVPIRHQEGLRRRQLRRQVKASTDLYHHYRFAYFKAPPDGRKTAPLAAFGWDPDVPARTACEFNLPELVWPDENIFPDAWVAKWAGAFDVEISCMSAVRREGNTFTVERFHLVKQEGGMAHTEMAPTALGELMQELLAQGQAQEARSLKCWAHSHPGMGVFWSKTDDTTCRLLASDYMVSLVVSDGFAVRARIDTSGPLAFTVDNVPVFCRVPIDKAKVGQYEKEVAEKVKAASRSLFGDVARQDAVPALLDDEPWSDYFGTAYSLFDDEDTAEVEAVSDDPGAFL